MYFNCTAQKSLFEPNYTGIVPYMYGYVCSMNCSSSTNTKAQNEIMKKGYKQYFPLLHLMRLIRLCTLPKVAMIPMATTKQQKSGHVPEGYVYSTVQPANLLDSSGIVLQKLY